MSSRTPLVVAILHAEADDVDYQLYGAAYGIEMQVSGDWNAEAVLLTPHDHLYAVTKNTGVTTEADSIVSAGVTDLPMSEDGVPNVAVLNHHKNNWLLVGDPRRNDKDELVAKKLKAALDSNCRVIICFNDTTNEYIATQTNSLLSIDWSRIVIALVHPDATNPNVATPFAQSIRTQLAAINALGDPRIIVSGSISGEIAKNIVGIEGIDGVILMDDKYDDWGMILEILEAFDDATSSGDAA